MEFLASFCTVSDKYLSERFLVDFETNRTFFFKYHGVRVVSTPLQMSFLSAAAALHRGISHFSTLTKINIDKNI
jgi:hypothetical protein